MVGSTYHIQQLHQTILWKKWGKKHASLVKAFAGDLTVVSQKLQWSIILCIVFYTILYHALPRHILMVIVWPRLCLFVLFCSVHVYYCLCCCIGTPSTHGSLVGWRSRCKMVSWRCRWVRSEVVDGVEWSVWLCVFTQWNGSQAIVWLNKSSTGEQCGKIQHIQVLQYCTQITNV